MEKTIHPFENALMVMRDELEFSLEHFGPVPWSDFLMRWSLHN